MNAHVTLPLVALLFLLTACGPSADHVRIEGEYGNLSNSEFYIYDESGQSGPPDTIAISEGRFTFERPLSEPCVLTLLYPNFSEIRLIAEPGKTITIKGDANQLMKTEVSGTEENEALTQFRLENSSRPLSDQLLAASQYIRSHPDRLSAEALFLQYFARAERFDRRTLELLDTMRRAQPDKNYLTELRRRLEPMVRTAPGAALPDFTATDIDGDTVRASNYGKRPLVVLFWSSWNPQSRAYSRALHSCRKAYGDRFDVLTLSFDYSAHTTRRRALTDSLPGTIVCDGRSFDSPLTARLGVRYVPGLLLVDKNRRIVSRDLPADEIYNALGKLITP